MAKHKAPTQVTIASTREETALHQTVEKYWKPAAGIAVLAAGGILFSQYLGQQSLEAEHESWRRLSQEVTFSLGRIQTPSTTVLAGLASELDDGVAGAWAKGLEVGEALRTEDYETARRALDELEAAYPDHPLVNARLYPVPGDEDAPHRTLRQQIDAGIPALEAWEEAHPGLFTNPDLPGDAPQVRIKTDRGDLVLGLYSDRAPKHTENFLKLCGEGFYDGTKFHRVLRNQLIQGGDPNSREGEPDTWGQGGPGYTIEAEIDGLWHFPLFVAAAKQAGDTESSGSQFYIMTSEADVHHLDGDYTIFGQLLEGASVVDELAADPLEGDRPTAPATIESTEVL